VRFASTVPSSKLTDVTLRTDYFDTDPRRFDAVTAEESKSEEVAVLAELLRNTVNRLVKGKDGAATSGPTGKKGGAAKKNETPEQAQKREAKEAKMKAAAEAQKAKIKAEIEAREKAKQEQIEKKKADEAAIAEKRKQAIDAKTKDAKDRRAREEADGTAGKRRAAEKARKARLERTKKLKKAKLAAKTPKDRATMVRLAAEDSQQAAKQYMVKGDDGSIKVLDRLL
jgi:colicin import membrane protein